MPLHPCDSSVYTFNLAIFTLHVHVQCDSSGGGQHPAPGDSEHEAHQWGPENKVQGGAIVPRLVYTSTTGIAY